MIDPYSIQIANGGGVRRLFSGADVLGERQFSLIFFSKEFLERNPDTATKFLAGYKRAIRFINENPDEANALMAEQLGLDESVVVTHKYTEDARVNLEDVQFWIEVLREGGELADAPDLSATDIATDRFNNP